MKKQQNFFSLNDKNILYIGATGYLGKKISIDLASSGANLIINGTNTNKLKKLKKEIDLINPCEIAEFDVSNIKEIKKFCKSYGKKPINCIINSANIPYEENILTIKNVNYINSFNVSVLAAQNIFKCLYQNLKLSVKQTGDSSFINISSVYSMFSPEIKMYSNKPNPPSYGTAKAALNQWTRYAACQFAKENIRFNTISPGAFPNTKNIKDKKLIESLKNKIPVGKFGSPEDLSGIIIYLASNSSKYCTGSNIIIDGGWSSQI